MLIKINITKFRNPYAETEMTFVIVTNLLFKMNHLPMLTKKRQSLNKLQYILNLAVKTEMKI